MVFLRAALSRAGAGGEAAALHVHSRVVEMICKSAHVHANPII